MTRTAPTGFASLRARLITLTLALSIGLLALATILERFVGLGSELGPRAAVVFLLTMAIAVGRIAGSHPFAHLGPANRVTAIRTALVALIAALLTEVPNPTAATTAVVVAAVAASLDGWDGWLARRSGMDSAFGARFDMEIDAALILILGVFAWRYDKAGAWILLSGILRYAFVAAGWGFAWFRRPLPPSLRRKTACVVQIVGLIVAIAPIVGRPLSAVIAGTTLVLLAWSFAVDVVWLWRMRDLPAAA